MFNLNPAYFSTSTMFFYYMVGIVVAWLIGVAKARRLPQESMRTQAWIAVFIILVAFAALRKVTFNIGGSDALGYQINFINNLRSLGRYSEIDQGFGIFTHAIRLFTNDPVAYRFICYSLIAFGYIYFIRSYCPNGGSAIPFILLIWPYIKSFNTMRNSLAIAIFMIGLVFLLKRKWLWVIVAMVVAVSFHRMTVIYLLLLPFCWLFKKYISRMNGKKLFVFLCFYVVIGYIAARILQNYVLALGLLDDSAGQDSYYISMSVGRSIFANWPMLFPHFMLMLCMVFYYKRLPSSRAANLIKVFVVFDIIILPAAIVLGMWRASEYLNTATLILWAMLIPTICSRLDKLGGTIVRYAFITAFMGLLYIRFTHEWNECKIMPYLFIWQ